MSFKKGDKVVFLEEKGEGVIQEVISKTHVRLIDEIGFERIYPIVGLGHYYSNSYKVNENDLKAKIEQSSTSQPKNTQSSKSVFKNAVERIDLHIEELISSHAGMSNGEILMLQVSYFKQQFAYAIDKRINKLEVIHGVGEGVLRNEIHQYLRQFKGVEFNDLSYTRNGFGGTEVIITLKEFTK
jgi:hypothetical protein